MSALEKAIANVVAIEQELDKAKKRSRLATDELNAAYLAESQLDRKAQVGWKTVRRLASKAK